MKAVLFHILWPFRGLIQLALRLVCALFLLCFVIKVFVSGLFEQSTLVPLAIGIAASALSFHFDELLLKLMPGNRDIV